MAARRGPKIRGQAPEEEIRGDNKGHGNGGWSEDPRRPGKFRVVVPFGHGRVKDRRAKSAEDAERIWNELIALRDSDLDNDGANITLKQLYHEYITKVINPKQLSGTPYAPKTIENYFETIDRYLMPTWGNYRLPAFKKVQLILDIHSAIMTKHGHYAADNAMRKLHMLLDAAIRWDYLESNAVAKARPQLPTYVTKEKEAMTVEDVRRLVAYIERHRWAGLYYIAVMLGLRLGELLGLQWDDIDWEKKTITIQRQMQEVRGQKQIRDTTKTTKMRVLPLTPRLEQQLRQSLSPTTSPFLFPTDENTPQAPTNFSRHFSGGDTGDKTTTGKSKIVTGIRQKARLPSYVTAHTFRHTVATLLLDLGIQGEIRDKILGHGKKGIRGRYAHATTLAMHQALQALEKHIFGEE
jgi:integrase